MSLPLKEDRRFILTLDGGGTHFVFRALRGGEPWGPCLEEPARGDDLEACLAGLVRGFEALARELPEPAAAISFAFPGPADYAAGIIGDLPNLSAFRGGVPLGPLLAQRFGLPVFINNDGDLFALGEALAGFLPAVNEALADSGSPRRYRNLLGVTFGTGFGAGIVHDGRLYRGDNGAAAEIFLLRGRERPAACVEEAISIRGLRRDYAILAGLPPGQSPPPKTIAAIALGEAAGERYAAAEAFRRFGREAGEAIASAVTLLDCLTVIGGGIAGSAELFLPHLVRAMNESIEVAGTPQRRLVSRAHDFEAPRDRAAFLATHVSLVPLPGTDRSVPYEARKRVAVGLSRLGTSRAVALGSSAFALAALDQRRRA